jgi:Sec7-like guanine-nucleotide exchange factor
VFSRSALLSAEAIVAFVEQLRIVRSLYSSIVIFLVVYLNLCRLCTVQLSERELPRVFSLQKMVEVTQYNMNRVRLVWSRMWSAIAPHMVRVGCHPDLQVTLRLRHSFGANVCVRN